MPECPGQSPFRVSQEEEARPATSAVMEAPEEAPPVEKRLKGSSSLRYTLPCSPLLPQSSTPKRFTPRTVSVEPWAQMTAHSPILQVPCPDRDEHRPRRSDGGRQ